MTKFICAAGLMLAAFACAVPTRAEAACTPVATAAELQAIAGNLAGEYCLTADIDLGTIASFTPIGRPGAPFTGQFDGGNHAIRNLTISTRGVTVGLFGVVTGGTVQNLTLLNASVQSITFDAETGVLAGRLLGATIDNVHVQGSVSCKQECAAGGISGTIARGATVARSSSAADVTVPEGDSVAGGAFGFGADSTFVTTFATGRVTCDDFAVCAGFAGWGASASYSRSYATGTVTCGFLGGCGGFMALSDGSTLRNVYATGSVIYGELAIAGGLIGEASNSTVHNTYAAGLVVASSTSCGCVGGLIADNFGGGSVTNSLWDKDTTGLTTSDGGQGRTTAQMRANLRDGFWGAIWGISPKLSYPFLDGLVFKSTLATLVVDSELYTFLPLSQLETWNYKGATNNIDQASLAACYTMIARGIGETQDTGLRDVAIDRYFWVDATQQTFWRGPVKNYATLGTFKAIGPTTSLIPTVVAEMKKGSLVLLRASYRDAGATRTSWMLGTLFTRGDDDTPNAIFANDPLTGKQVRIDPATKKIVSPVGFPLNRSTIDGYQTVTVAPPPS